MTMHPKGLACGCQYEAEEELHLLGTGMVQFALNRDLCDKSAATLMAKVFGHMLAGYNEAEDEVARNYFEPELAISDFIKAVCEGYNARAKLGSVKVTKIDIEYYPTKTGVSN